MYVARLWMGAVKACPTLGLSPTDYGWTMQNDLLVPLWFEGPAIPDALFASSSAGDVEIVDECDDQDRQETESSDSDKEAWSEGSESDMEDSDFDFDGTSQFDEGSPIVQ